jgi:hypothetical protein
MAGQNWRDLEIQIIDILRQQGWHLSRNAHGDWCLCSNENESRIFNISFLAQALSAHVTVADNALSGTA